MQEYHDIHSITLKLRENKPELEKSSKDSFWVSSFLMVILAIIVSGLVPFVNAHLSNSDAKQTKAVDEQLSLKTPIEHVEAYVWTTKLKVEELNLHHRLDVKATNKNSIIVDGKISKEEAGDWDTFLKWYESKADFPPLSHKVEATAISGNIPKLQSVWFNEEPTAYFKDGSFGSIGTVIQDGWEIKGIEPWAVFVERDNAIITLNFQ